VKVYSECFSYNAPRLKEKSVALTISFAKMPFDLLLVLPKSSALQNRQLLIDLVGPSFDPMHYPIAIDPALLVGCLYQLLSAEGCLIQRVLPSVTCLLVRIVVLLRDDSVSQRVMYESV
jgi:hypothetical protein